MANTQIDVGVSPDIDDISATAAGTVTNTVRVVIAEGASKHDAHVALQAIAAALQGDSITLQ
jgi:hypothetical protein